MSETTTKATRRQRQALAEIDRLLKVKRKREVKRDLPPIYDHGAVTRGVRSVNDVSRRIERLQEARAER